MHILADFLIDTVAREETLNSERGYLFGLFFYLFLIQLDPSSARNLVRKAQFKKEIELYFSQCELWSSETTSLSKNTF